MILLAAGGNVGDGSNGVKIETSGLGVVLLFLLLALELKDKLLARGELEAGRAVQEALVPARAPALAGWDLFLYTRPANDVGGDLVDALDLGDGRVALVLADVAGKGLPAALLMAKLQATVRALAPEAPSLDVLAERVNRILHRDGLPSSFSTLVYLELGADTDRVRLVNAGHMPPIVVGPSGLSELPRGGPALALIAGTTYREQEVSIPPGYTLVVYTDGVTEAMDPNGEFFGDDRLRESLLASTGLGAEALAARLLAQLKAFVADAPTHDDVSLVVARRKASGTGAALALAAALSLGWAPAVVAQPTATPAGHALLLTPDAPGMNRQAPARFEVRMDTSRGVVVIEVHRAWAALGADRFYNLVEAGYYDGVRVHRVIGGRWAQFGINGDPVVARLWRDRTIPDDPRRESNVRGTVAFAFAVANGRTTQVFINLADNRATHDAEPFVPFGTVASGMDVVDELYRGVQGNRQAAASGRAGRGPCSTAGMVPRRALP